MREEVEVSEVRGLVFPMFRSPRNHNILAPTLRRASNMNNDNA